MAVSFEECHGDIPKDIYDKVSSCAGAARGSAPLQGYCSMAKSKDVHLYAENKRLHCPVAYLLHVYNPFFQACVA